MKKILFFFGILIALFIINGLIQSIYNLSQKGSVVERAKQELIAQEEKNKKLKKELAQVKDPEFIEKEARNKLFLIKPGEQMVLIPSPSVAPMPEYTNEAKVKKSNFQMWYDYFFTSN